MHRLTSRSTASSSTHLTADEDTDDVADGTDDDEDNGCDMADNGADTKEVVNDDDSDKAEEDDGDEVDGKPSGPSSEMEGALRKPYQLTASTAVAVGPEASLPPLQFGSEIRSATCSSPTPVDASTLQRNTTQSPQS